MAINNLESDSETAIADPTPSSSLKRGAKFCSLRALPRKFGISFTIPDRVAAEISDKRKVRGAHPLRIQRIAKGGAMEFCRAVEEAERESPPLMSGSREKKVSGRRFYHRARLNDWHPLVFYQIPGLKDSEEPPFLPAV